MFVKSLRISFLMFIAMTVITGVAYPALTTGIIQALFPVKAEGSLITGKDGKTYGSELIGQNFSDPGYFWGRLSATGPMPYNAAASSGSNLGVNDQRLLDAVKARMEALQAADPDNKAPIPVDLVTASGSGLDPHISVAAANYQIRRVAKARGISYENVGVFVERHTENRLFGLLGETVVNVLMLNLDLDSLNQDNAGKSRK